MKFVSSGSNSQCHKKHGHFYNVFQYNISIVLGGLKEINNDDWAFLIAKLPQKTTKKYHQQLWRKKQCADRGCERNILVVPSPKKIFTQFIKIKLPDGFENDDTSGYTLRTSEKAPKFCHVHWG